MRLQSSRRRHSPPCVALVIRIILASEYSFQTLFIQVHVYVCISLMECPSYCSPWLLMKSHFMHLSNIIALSCVSRANLNNRDDAGAGADKDSKLAGGKPAVGAGDGLIGKGMTLV